MSIVAVLVDDVAKGEQVQFFIGPTTSDVNWEKDRHRYEAADEAGGGCNLQVAE